MEKVCMKRLYRVRGRYGFCDFYLGISEVIALSHTWLSRESIVYTFTDCYNGWIYPQKLKSSVAVTGCIMPSWIASKYLCRPSFQLDPSPRDRSQIRKGKRHPSYYKDRFKEKKEKRSRRGRKERGKRKRRKRRGRWRRICFAYEGKGSSCLLFPSWKGRFAGGNLDLSPSSNESGPLQGGAKPSLVLHEKISPGVWTSSPLET